jgi:predicted dehydrogenase
MKDVDVTIVGGGMITYDLILPTVYHLQRTGAVRNISVCSLNTPPLAALAESSELRAAFPAQSFRPYPDLAEDPNKMFPDLYKEVLAAMTPRQAVIVAVPDQLHYAGAAALHSDQHVPVAAGAQIPASREIEQLAYRRVCSWESSTTAF